ncbi:transcriptional regulator, TetR family [Pseudonocardia thermophila]|uniref:Transcriptional regulator, TetR family n=1 Tax=Pseudonocardia thermophila TaxID=1848 RepID=A0A1M6QEG6_PSETH|nr:TetR/AcrR family transcriptional regulator [Pseudonocardia thermophila]SHK18586.1 transcriptional regulator, TetR family [Pseudonocardia thermophila]
MAMRQQERSESTRARLMDAMIECLVERGWSGTTTTEVAQRAGVSRGAQLHHYPTRADLVVAAVAHLGAARFAETREAAAALPVGAGRTRAVLEMLAELHTGPLFRAALELLVAARTDPELHAVVAPLEAEIGRSTHRLTVELLGADESLPGVRTAVQQTLDMVRGLGIDALVSDDRTRRTALLDDWARHLDARLAAATEPPG